MSNENNQYDFLSFPLVAAVALFDWIQSEQSTRRRASQCLSGGHPLLRSTRIQPAKKLQKTRPETKNFDPVLKLVQYAKEGHNALLALNLHQDTGRVPSAVNLQSLEHTLVRVHKASHAL